MHYVIGLFFCLLYEVLKLVSALVGNKGLIQADGGSVLMTARASNALLNTLVKNDGIIQAQTVENRSGMFFLDGGTDNIASGTVLVAGTLDASAPVKGDGGFIETSGSNNGVANLPVTLPVVIEPPKTVSPELEQTKDIVSIISVATKVTNTTAKPAVVAKAEPAAIIGDYRLINQGMRLPEDATSSDVGMATF